MVDVRPEITHRLKALELIVLWEGRLVTNRLSDWFCISRQQASADIKHYASELNPGSLRYNNSLRGYEPVDEFAPVLTTGHINEYLQLISAQGAEPMAQVLESHASVAAVQLPDRAVRPEVVRELIRAARYRESLTIHYSSMSEPEPQARDIAPHTLVYSGFRWHVRAWCYMRKDYRDFLLSRISGTPTPIELVAPPVEEDHLWQEEVDLRLIANSRLTPKQRQLIAQDYGMTDNSIHIRVRKALAHYTLQRYQAAISDQEAERPFEHPLQLMPADRQLLAPYLFQNELIQNEVAT